MKYIIISILLLTISFSSCVKEATHPMREIHVNVSGRIDSMVVFPYYSINRNEAIFIQNYKHRSEHGWYLFDLSRGDIIEFYDIVLPDTVLSSIIIKVKNDTINDQFVIERDDNDVLNNYYTYIVK